MPDVDTDLPPELGMLAETLGFDDAKAKALKEFIRTCVRLDSETGPYDAGGDPGLDEEA